MGSVEYVRRGLITGVLGRVLLSGGVLILLFVAYQLWGTGIVESHSQAVLRQRFDAQLHHVVPTEPVVDPTTSTTTTTASGDQPTVGASTTAPTTATRSGLLHIAKIGLDKVIVEGTSTDDLRQGPGHYTGTPLPGEAGNAAIAGHRTTYGAPFYNLDRASPRRHHPGHDGPGRVHLPRDPHAGRRAPATPRSWRTPRPRSSH